MSAYLTAANGKEAVSLLRTQPFDPGLMDIQMPEMGGYQAPQHIGRQKEDVITADIPVIATIANDMKGEREKAWTPVCTIIFSNRSIPGRWRNIG